MVLITTVVLMLIISGRRTKMVTIDENNEVDRGEVSKLVNKEEKIDKQLDVKTSYNPSK